MRQKKTIRAALALALIAGCCACSSVQFYDFTDNWVIRDNATPRYAGKFDVIYLYPSLIYDSGEPHLNWMQANQTEEIYNYTRSQTSAVFGREIRIFSPFVRQLNFRAYSSWLQKHRESKGKNGPDKTLLRPAVEDMTRALKYYLKNYHAPGRPFVIIGQEQGAVILYEAMKACREITPENGFAAAYFMGLPDVTRARIIRDFGGRGIQPAENEYDTPAIAVWNSTSSGSETDRSFACKNGYVINPLNWKTDAVPAPAHLNSGAVLCHAAAKELKKRIQVIPHFCGAVADPENGLLMLTGLPAGSEWNLSETSFRSPVWGVFMMNLRKNAHERVKQFIHLSRRKNP